MERVAQRLDELGLAESGHAFQQDMAFREKAGQNAIDDFAVTDNDFGNLSLEQFELLLEQFHLLVEFGDHFFSRGRMA
jgi:hypothetical protein